MNQSNEGYLIPQHIELCFYKCKDINLNLLPTANVVAVFVGVTPTYDECVDFILCEVNPPNLNAKMYLHSTGETSIVGVKDLYDLIQKDAWCWSMI